MRLAARLLCAMTFPVLWLGGLVTSTKAGMAVPDWPNTYGYNLFLYPWQTWLWGPWDLFVEHGHRLLASALGVCAIVLALLLWRSREQPSWLRWMGLVALLGVIAQGVLGGARVLLDDRWFAMTHGVTGPIYFGFTVAMVAWTSQWWRSTSQLTQEGQLDYRPIALLLLVTTYTQLVLGAIIRHLPADFSPLTFLAAARFHLAFAAIITLLWLGLAYSVRRRQAPRPVRRVVSLVGVVLALQLLLGLFTWCYEYAVPTWVEQLTGWHFGAIVADGWWQSLTVTAHQANGSLLLAATVAFLLVSWRLAPNSTQEAVLSTPNPTAPARSALA